VFNREASLEELLEADEEDADEEEAEEADVEEADVAEADEAVVEDAVVVLLVELVSLNPPEEEGRALPTYTAPVIPSRLPCKSHWYGIVAFTLNVTVWVQADMVGEQVPEQAPPLKAQTVEHSKLLGVSRA